jgi:hypothetical protein
MANGKNCLITPWNCSIASSKQLDLPFTYPHSTDVTLLETLDLRNTIYQTSGGRYLQVLTHPFSELGELTKMNDQYMLAIELSAPTKIAAKLGELSKLDAKLDERTSTGH